MVSRPAASSSSLTYDRVNRGLFSDFLLLCLTIRGAEEAAVRLWGDQEFMARLRLLDDPIKESRHVMHFCLVPTVSSLQFCCRAVIRNYGNLLLSCGRFDEVVEWYDAMKDSPAVLASGAHGIAITACFRFVLLSPCMKFTVRLQRQLGTQGISMWEPNFFRLGTAEAYQKATEFSNRLKEEDAFRYRRTVLLYALMACRQVNMHELNSDHLI